MIPREKDLILRNFAHELASLFLTGVARLLIASPAYPWGSKGHEIVAAKEKPLQRRGFSVGSTSRHLKITSQTFCLEPVSERSI